MVAYANPSTFSGALVNKFAHPCINSLTNKSFLAQKVGIVLGYIRAAELKK